MNKKKIIIIILIILCAAIAFYSMSGVLTPYVSFKTAQETGNEVQIIGKKNKSIPPQYNEKSFSFSLEDDDGTLMDIVYNGAKPLNFDQATKIVAIGFYNKDNKKFEAEKLLVKCPSKYIKEE